MSPLMSASYFHSWVTQKKKKYLRDVYHGDIASGKLQQYSVTNDLKSQEFKVTIIYYNSHMTIDQQGLH